jgi:predicted secreted protein
MAKKGFPALILLFLCSGLLAAGDVASFVNLGFSDNSRYFMFSQYGIDDETEYPFAELYMVDVYANKFTLQGVKKEDYKADLMPGQDGSGAFYSLLTSNASLPRSYGINHLKTGRLVYLLLDGEVPKSHIEFRDFNTGNQYSINLVQMSSGEGKTVKASFHLQVTVVFSGGNVKAYTVGLPGYYRSGVKTYRIRQVILSPDEQSVVFVIEKEYPAGTGKTIRYMVETVKVQ